MTQPTPPKPHPRTANELVVGYRYKVYYQIPGVHRKPRVMLAQFIGAERFGRKTSLSFSGRPQFGTTDLDKDWVLSVEVYTGPLDNYSDRKVN